MMRTIVALLLLSPALAGATTYQLAIVPGLAGTASEAGFAANTLVCFRQRWRDPQNDGDGVAVAITAGAGGAICGAASYDDFNDSSQTRFVSTSGSCASAGLVRQSGLPGHVFQVGTIYRHCVCASATGVTFLAVDDLPSTTNGAASNSTLGGSGLAAAWNLFGTYVGTAANACSGGTPPLFTGALTPSSTLRLVPITIDQE